MYVPGCASLIVLYFSADVEKICTFTIFMLTGFRFRYENIYLRFIIIITFKVDLKGLFRSHKNN
jgi:hypothetical protein